MSPWSRIDLSGTLADATRRVVAEVERRKIEQALQAKPAATAARRRDLLQISYKMLLASKLKEYGIPDPAGLMSRISDRLLLVVALTSPRGAALRASLVGELRPRERDRLERGRDGDGCSAPTVRSDSTRRRRWVAATVRNWRRKFRVRPR